MGVSKKLWFSLGPAFLTSPSAEDTYLANLSKPRGLARSGFLLGQQGWV